MDEDRLSAILEEIEESLEYDEYDIFPEGLTYQQVEGLLEMIREKIVMNTK